MKHGATSNINDGEEIKRRRALGLPVEHDPKPSHRPDTEDELPRDDYPRSELREI